MKLRPILLLFLIFACWIPASLIACPADAFDTLTAPLLLYPAAKAAALAKLQVKDPSITDVEVVGERGTFRIKLHRGATSEILEDSHFEPAQGKKNFSYDVDIPLEYREAGLNRLFVAEYLDKYPGTMEARLSFYDSNRNGFFQTLLNSGNPAEPTQKRLTRSARKAAVEKLLQAKSPSEIRRVREWMERAAREGTPAGKIQTSVGMGRVKRIVVTYTSNLEDVQVHVDFALGEPGPVSEVKVFLTEFNSEDSVRGETVDYRELLPDGTLKPGRGIVAPY